MNLLFINSEKSTVSDAYMLRLNLVVKVDQHDLAPRIYVLHKITIALKFMSYINLKLRPSHQTPLNLCLT